MAQVPIIKADIAHVSLIISHYESCSTPTSNFAPQQKVRSAVSDDLGISSCHMQCDVNYAETQYSSMLAAVLTVRHERQEELRPNVSCHF